MDIEKAKKDVERLNKALRQIDKLQKTFFSVKDKWDLSVKLREDLGMSLFKLRNELERKISDETQSDETQDNLASCFFYFYFLTKKLKN